MFPMMILKNIYDWDRGCVLVRLVLGTKWFVADCSSVVFLLWFIFTGQAFLQYSYSWLSACDLLNVVLVFVFLSHMMSWTELPVL